MVAYGRISYEEDDRKEKIAAYWTKRSDSFWSREERNCTVRWQTDGWKKSGNICLKGRKTPWILKKMGIKG